MKTLLIKDLHIARQTSAGHRTNARLLSPAEAKRIRGGRAVSVTVDGRPGGTVDDFDINNAIFEGRIKGPFLL